MRPPVLLLDLPSNWLEAAITLLVIVGWAIRALFSEKEKEKQKPSASPPAQRRAPGGGLEGLERWRELLEGRRTEDAPPVKVEAAKPPPVPRHPQRPELEEGAERTADRKLERPAAAPVFVAAPSEAELARRTDESVAVDTIAPGGIAPPARLTGGVESAVVERRLRGWRTAVVSAEILGRPLALRTAQELPGSLPR